MKIIQVLYEPHQLHLEDEDKIQADKAVNELKEAYMRMQQDQSN